MVRIQSVTLLSIDSVTIKVEPRGKRLAAHLTARRQSWDGLGDTAPEAIKAVFAAMGAEQRPHDKGRPPTRYAVAQSVLSWRG